MIVFIAGIHGVGKTYLSDHAAKELGIRHATASQLIREERSKESWSDDKMVSEVDENQRALISAARRIKAEVKALLLDGHFVLRTQKRHYTIIPESVFRDLNIDAILLVEAATHTILERLSLRGDNTWDGDEVVAFSEREKSHSQQIAANLQIPFRSLNEPSQPEFLVALTGLMKQPVR